MKENNVYLTTPIYYPNDNLHIGHTYTNIATDTISRFYKLKGKNVFFTTGSDEHGQKIEKTALSKHISPQEHVDEMAENSKKLWKDLNVEYDYFARTTSPLHEEIVQTVWKIMEDNGDIYLDEYEGWYCVSDETFLNDSEVHEGTCQICGKVVEKIKEESYFFRMSKYTNWIKEYYEKNPSFVQPNRVQKELLNNFIDKGLKDLSISRTSFKWGVKVPGNEKHIMYVWIDALFNYLSSLKFSKEDSNMDLFWNNSKVVHIVGKEITRFHAIYWPIFLKSIGVKIPDRIFAHGWLLMKDGKMSKSKGNVIRPNTIIDRYGSDPLRYFLLREIPFGSDGKFTPENFLKRYNSDLVNDFSNLVYRTVSMAKKYLDGHCAQPEQWQYVESRNLFNEFNSVAKKIEQNFEYFQLNEMVDNIWSLISMTNKYIDQTSPWIVAKEKNEKIKEIIFVLVECIKKITVLVSPLMPEASDKVQKILRIKNLTWDDIEKLSEKYNVDVNSKPLFNRLDIDEELEYFEYELKKKK